MKAVRVNDYGSVDVLELAEVQRPAPRRDQVVVEVVATAINPGEVLIREGAMDGAGSPEPPFGQGSDLAGRIHEVGDDVAEWAVGDEVLGWTDERAAQAEFVAVPADQLSRRPPGVPWEQAASLYVAGCTAYGMVDAANVRPGETVVVAGAAGGVGSIAIQLLRRGDVHVIGVAGGGNSDWLAAQGLQPVRYGDGLVERLREAAPNGIDALLDAYGGGYVEQATELGVASDRIVTIIDFEAADRHGARTVFGHQVASAGVLSEFAGLIDSGELSVPIAVSFPLAEVREAYTRLAERHTRGKIVLRVAE